MKAWVAYIVVSIASFIAYRIAWGVSFYWVLLTCLAVIAAVLGFIALRLTGVKRWSLATVILGFVIGQWWLIQFLLIVAFGKSRGFAP